MQYPLISEYVRAIQDASSNLDKLAHLVPVLDDHGEPYRSSGAFAVVFKMKDEQTGKCYALKCFTEEQEGRAEAYRQIADELEFANSAYITSVKYLEKEIFVDSSCEEDEFPVLLMDWIDGETMESYIAENYQDNYAMAMLCYRFCKMAAWLRSQPFAHGDIKPDNIMVRPDGSLTLVDYDGMFVPAMKGQKSPTIGTKDFSHPLRTVDDFDETIDDFALASIALSLKAISLKPSLLDEYGAADRLLFSVNDYNKLCKINLWKKLSKIKNMEIKKLQTCLRLAENRQNYDNLLISCVKEPTKDTTLEKVDFLKARAISAVCSSRQLQEHLTSNTHYDLIDLTSQKSENSYPIKEILALLAVLSFFALYFIDEELFLNVFLFFMASSSVIFMIIGFVIYAGIILLGGYLLFVIIKKILKK
ncbi:serine/threonine-protein kinase [Segatella copri]|uniref:serine/threonine-protein kinase n=1 Tax=Segatella copri TaxID=165179 RepID=UPI00294AAFBC|nr:serine/threonine-protein kinase [Segatella copri]